MKLRLNDKSGFTLIEMLVVLALTMMVMGLIFGPLVQSLKITRSAEIMIRAQDNARFALAHVGEDLSNAMYVFDNTHNYTIFPVFTTSGTPVYAKVYNARVDLILPRERGYCPVDTTHTPGGIPQGEEAAPVCPVCGAQLDLKPIQPLTQDTKIVRYFIGLKDPTQPYSNGYQRTLAEANAVDNTFVLYRAEFLPSDPSLFPPDPKTGLPRSSDENLNDPGFFYNPGYAAAWRKISKPVVTLEDIDLVSIEYDSYGNPSVSPTVKFTPTAIYNDPLVPTTSDENNPDLAETAPATYKATYGNWVTPYKVIVEPDANDPLNKVATYTYETMQGIAQEGAYDPDTDMCVYAIEHSKTGATAPHFAFNMTHYQATRGVSPFDAGEMWPLDATKRLRAFTVDTTKGTVNFAFPNVTDSNCINLNNLSPAIPAAERLTLSDRTSSTLLNDPSANPAARFLLNCPHNTGGDPRILYNATVVPGSVKITAPDVEPVQGTHPQVQYARVPYLMRDPGPKQFTVDVAHNLDEHDNPLQGVAAVYFHKPSTVDQSIYGTLPDGQNNIMIYYQVQNNLKGDVIRANYVTKSVMTVVMGIRLYDNGSKRPQFVQLTDRIRLKNVGS